MTTTAWCCHRPRLREGGRRPFPGGEGHPLSKGQQVKGPDAEVSGGKSGRALRPYLAQPLRQAFCMASMVYRRNSCASSWLPKRKCRAISRGKKQHHT